MSLGSSIRTAILLSAIVITVEGYLPAGSRVRVGTTTMGGVGDDRGARMSSTSPPSSMTTSIASSRASISATSSNDQDYDDGGDDPILGIIFDIDGTLADSWNLGYRATLAVLARYHNDHRHIDDGGSGEDGVVDSSLSSFSSSSSSSSSSSCRLTPETYPLSPEEYHHGCRYTTPERLARHVGLVPDHPSFAAVGEALGREFDDYYVRLVDRDTAGFYGGIADLLVGLNRGADDAEVGADGSGSATGLKLGALTNACVEYAHAVLRANCPKFSNSDSSSVDDGDDDDDDDENYIYERFSSIHGANSVPRPKPYGDGILKCCEEMNLHPSRVVYVGDAPTDARAAVDAGCRAAIGVLWGSNDEECLRKEAGFATLCRNVEELATAIERFL
ncbi:hypothetical protein ACHAXA_001143 [Cyclostephanos tholiformis]|uniref:Uncharacterized protein n=1 Tax=Cyclostephanos tholiformis TaxID=382380 RepID=A0ABD3R4B6_9STRA